MGCGCGRDLRGFRTGTVSFLEAANPVAAFIRGIQSALGALPTGSWDKTTHNALATYTASLAASLPAGTNVSQLLPAWGENPAAIGNLVIMLPIMFAAPGAWANPSMRVADFVAGWGIPATNSNQMEVWLTENMNGLQSMLPAVDEQIVLAETGKSVSWFTTGIIAAVVAIGGIAVGRWIFSGKKE
jgi:hypothetical protein